MNKMKLSNAIDLLFVAAVLLLGWGLFRLAGYGLLAVFAGVVLLWISRGLAAREKEKAQEGRE